MAQQQCWLCNSVGHGVQGLCGVAASQALFTFGALPEPALGWMFTFGVQSGCQLIISAHTCVAALASVVGRGAFFLE